MKIFVLDDNVQKCVDYRPDHHVIKMILESTQMLCAVLSQKGISPESGI
jgi:hypothetical protein